MPAVRSPAPDAIDPDPAEPDQHREMMRHGLNVRDVAADDAALSARPDTPVCDFIRRRADADLEGADPLSRGPHQDPQLMRETCYLFLPVVVAATPVRARNHGVSSGGC